MMGREELIAAQQEGLRPSRNFATGATRDTDKGKYDLEGFQSPLVEERFGEYMDKHRKQSNGEIRSSDNWQKGIPQEQYIKSAKRHLLDWWLIHRGYPDVAKEELEEALCGLIFNAQGYLFEVIKKRREQK